MDGQPFSREAGPSFLFPPVAQAREKTKEDQLKAHNDP